MKRDTYENLIKSDETALVIVDHQAAFSSCFEEGAIQAAQEATVALAEVAESLCIPTIVSMVETNTIQAGLVPECEDSFSHARVIKRTMFNPWQDEAFVRALVKTNRKRLVVAGLSSETSLTSPVLCALEEV